MWVEAHTDLADLYRDRLTLRQVWVRIQALPSDSYLRAVLVAEEERAAADEAEREVAAALAPFTAPKGT